MSQSRCLVSDLDETLFLTRRAVISAYALAGVPAALVEANWGRPWQTWCGIEQHSKKVKMYDRYINDPTHTPATSALRALRVVDAEVSILTSASHEAARKLIDREQLNAKMLAWSVTSTEKRHVLAGIAKRFQEIVYLDDDPNAIFWVPTNVRFVHYTGQDEAQLLKEIGWT